MLYLYKIAPRSPLITPLMSDTLFGHFCWAILYQKGEGYLSDFLNLYGGEKSAPVLFSSAFLSEYLPRPTIPPIKRGLVREFVQKHYGNGKKSYFEGMNKVKSWGKVRYISTAQWLKLKDDYSEARLFECFKDEGSLDEKKTYEIEVAAANLINRESGTVSQEAGGLFQREKIWYHDDVKLDLYVEIDDSEIADNVEWFLTDYLPANGFGADKSTGMGSLSIERDDSFDPQIFSVAEANACMALSLTAFQGMEIYNAYYRLKTKFGKLGGSFAYSSPTGGNPKPFKKPVLMYEPGAVFLNNDDLSSKPLLENVHSDSRIRHCGVPITLPFKFREDN